MKFSSTKLLKENKITPNQEDELMDMMLSYIKDPDDAEKKIEDYLYGNLSNDYTPFDIRTFGNIPSDFEDEIIAWTKKHNLNEAEEGENDNRVSQAELILPRGKKVVLQAEEKDYKRGLIVELTEEGGYKINYWYGDDVKVYPAEVLVDGESIKPDANEVYIKFHPELEEGTCGYDKTGNIDPENTTFKTPGGLKSIPGEKRTELIKKIMEKLKSK
jgi:hypothetical protein